MWSFVNSAGTDVHYLIVNLDLYDIRNSKSHGFCHMSKFQHMLHNDILIDGSLKSYIENQMMGINWVLTDINRPSESRDIHTLSEDDSTYIDIAELNGEFGDTKIGNWKSHGLSRASQAC